MNRLDNSSIFAQDPSYPKHTQPCKPAIFGEKGRQPATERGCWELHQPQDKALLGVWTHAEEAGPCQLHSHLRHPHSKNRTELNQSAWEEERAGAGPAGIWTSPRRQSSQDCTFLNTSTHTARRKQPGHEVNISQGTDATDRQTHSALSTDGARNRGWVVCQGQALSQMATSTPCASSPIPRDTH